MGECIFCNIIGGKLPAELVYEDDEFVAFKDVQPQAPHHYLVVPREHVTSLNDIDDEKIYGKMMIIAIGLAKKFGFDQDGYRVVANCNQDGGQTVFHIHYHVLGGRSMKWPPG